MTSSSSILNYASPFSPSSVLKKGQCLSAVESMISWNGPANKIHTSEASGSSCSVVALTPSNVLSHLRQMGEPFWTHFLGYKTIHCPMRSIFEPLIHLLWLLCQIHYITHNVTVYHTLSLSPFRLRHIRLRNGQKTIGFPFTLPYVHSYINALPCVQCLPL